MEILSHQTLFALRLVLGGLLLLVGLVLARAADRHLPVRRPYEPTLRELAGRVRASADSVVIRR